MPSPRALAVAAVLVACVPAARAAEPLRPVAGDRVAQNSAVVAAALQQAIADGETRQAEDLRTFVDVDNAPRVYHRDNQLLFAFSTRKNLSLREKTVGEREAAQLALMTLEQNFRHLLTSVDGFRGLDPASVRVVFVEPDAYEPCAGRRSSRSGWASGAGVGGPMPFAAAGLWANGWATSAPCTNCCR
jgi:hypothetical protein